MAHKEIELIRKSEVPGDFWERFIPTEGGRSERSGAYSDDDMIDAWNLGREAYRNEVLTMIKKQINENMRRSAEMARTIMASLDNEGMRPRKVYLRSAAMFDYEILIMVDEESFVSDLFDKIYNETWKLEQAERAETFRPTFRFMPIPANGDALINTKALEGDGYLFRLKYDAA